MSRSLNFAVWFVGLASYSNFAPKIVLDYKKKKRKLVDVDAVTRQHVSFPLGGLYTVFTNGGHAGKNCCLVMKARRWRVNKNCK